MAEMSSGGPSPIARAIDYMFGRNSLIGLASLMLLVISGYATWAGMNDFIVGLSSSGPASGREIVGGLSVTNEILVIAIVVALTFLMWLALRETFGAGRKWSERILTGVLYAFLAVWSVGFGYGFWWSLIAGEEATRSSLSGLQEDARDASAVVAARIEAVKAQLDSVVTWSESQMNREETSGGSCGVASGAGRGPLYNARATVRDQIRSLRDGVEQSWVVPVQRDIAELKQAAEGLTGATVEERQKSFEARAGLIRGNARSIAARSNELGQSTASEMRALAAAVGVEPGKPGFSCYDPTLGQRLRQAAEQAAQPAVLLLREAAFTEGPAGVAVAIKNLWANMGVYMASGLQYVMTGGKPPEGATATGEPITGRDVIALIAAIGIDLGLFVLTVLNPPATPPVRHQPSTGLILQIRKAMQTALDRAPDTDIEWVRRHFIYHNKASYFVTPNLASCDPDDPKECARGLAMNQLAGVFDDLGLVRWPTKWELFWLRRQEQGGSNTDLTDIRKERLIALEKMRQDGKTDITLDEAKMKRIRSAEPVRNHGLLSKAERALDIADWSDAAIRDVEIYRLEQAEGLTPLLAALNDHHHASEKPQDATGGTAGGKASAAPARA
ncbi:MAG: hypothetical protein NW217_07325 [Hyphomicrobiaceae bacterium]|nr:hypothetical protein [Hyphomicrobiaceae bacterium]